MWKFRYTCFITPFLALTCCLWLESSIAQVVENPRKPEAPSAGRVIVPKEVMTISGKGPSGHYFKHAWSPRVAPDGSLFVRTSSGSDAPQRLLMFDEAGRLVRNLEGPEPIGYSGYFLAGKNVVVFAEGGGYLAKLLWFNSAGIYQREINMPYEDCAGCWTPLAFFDGVFYFLYNRNSFPQDQNTKPGIVDIPRRILSFGESSGIYTPLASFPTKDYFFGCQCNGGVCTGELTSISAFMSAPYREKYFILCHTREYLLKIYDPASNAVIREFRRDYKRINNKQEKVETTIGGFRTAPHQKYTPDIINIFTRGDEIWAVTSTRDKAKGALIDIFDANGIYKDSFYIKLPEQLLNALSSNRDSTIDGNTLYIITRDQNCAIRKFLIGK